MMAKFSSRSHHTNGSGSANPNVLADDSKLSDKYFDENSKNLCRMKRIDPLLCETKSTPTAEDLTAIARCCLSLSQRIKSKIYNRRAPAVSSINNVLAKNLTTNESTVGITLEGAVIESMKIGGSAYVSGALNQGDTIVRVDGRTVTHSDAASALRGSDIPGSSVQITVNKLSMAEDSSSIRDLYLTRLSLKEANDRQRLLELLYDIKESSSESNMSFFMAQSPSRRSGIATIDECINQCIRMLAEADQQPDSLRAEKSIFKDVDDLRECLESLHHRIEALSHELSPSLSAAGNFKLQEKHRRRPGLIEISDQNEGNPSAYINGHSKRLKLGSVHSKILRILGKHRAKMIACANSLEEVTCSVSVEDALRAVEASDRYILVRKSSSSMQSSASEIILNRLDLVRIAIEADNIMQPLSSCPMVKNWPTVEFVNGDDTLDVAVEKMVLTGREDIAVMDQGVIRGLITSKTLAAFIRHQLHVQGSQPSYRRRLSLTSSGPAFGVRGGHLGLNSQYGSAIDMSLQLDHPTAQGSHQNPLKPKSSQLFSSAPMGSLDEAASLNEDEIVVKTNKESRNERQERSLFTESQQSAQVYCVSWCSDLWITLCVVIDLVIGIQSFMMESSDQPEAFTATGCILAAYFYERALRCYAFFQRLHYHPCWLMDFMIVDSSVLVYILILTGAISQESKAIVTMMRVLRMLRISLIIRNMQIAAKVRRVISSQKTRYKNDGFDLDLTYITKNVIAMSLPALGAEANYRNPLPEVQLFFSRKHPNHYMIFNLCQERYYDPELFDGRVERIEVEDHNPPRFNQIISFLERSGQFIEEDTENCLAVHCKGGKGRTGVMICAWLLYSGFSPNAKDALSWFSIARTGTNASLAQGVSQPSQKRYLQYTEEALGRKGVFSPSILLQEIIIKTCPRMKSDGSCNIWFTIEENGRLVFDYREHTTQNSKMHKNQDEMILSVNLEVQGDVRIMFYDHEGGDDTPLDKCWYTRGKVDEFEGDDLIFFVWYHTGFITAQSAVYIKEDIDIACHDHQCRVFKDNFAVEFTFGSIPDLSFDGSNLKGTYRKIIQPSQALLERSLAMREALQDPKAAHTASQCTSRSPYGLTLARLSSAYGRSTGHLPSSPLSSNDDATISRPGSALALPRIGTEVCTADKV